MARDNTLELIEHNKMRSFTITESERIKALTEKSVSLTLIEPTQTGLQKSIMDATAPVRLYLKNQNIHNYQEQELGPSHKHSIKSYLVESNRLIESTASLYRPLTKKGDPRIWFSNLNKYANQNDILGIINHLGILYVVNISRLNIKLLLEGREINPLFEIVTSIFNAENTIANELLGKLKIIASKGFIPSFLKADTAVGRTLETELGIYINSSKKPDYKGIELKSFRNERENRKTLFAQVADWNLSKFKSSGEILDNFGYYRENTLKLNCTVSTIKKNSQGLQFYLNPVLNQLIENSDNARIGDFAVWALEKLHERLIEKHNETFWIAAESRKLNGIEHFRYTTAEHTKKPIVSQFDLLLEQGIITMDHLIKRYPNGRVSERGPLFKIKPNSLDLLFPPSTTYNLLL